MKSKKHYLALLLGSSLFMSASSFAAAPATKIADWWPNRLDLSSLRTHGQKSNPMGSNFKYSKAFQSLDIDLLIADLKKVMTTSQDWWPADFGNYGPFFIRMAWHSAGTYRVSDGRGGAGRGMLRFAPLNSWPDNVNLDKARRLLWPIKQKYGNKISWADLMVLAGTVAIDSMGLKMYGYAGGRADVWEADDVNWGSEKKWLESKRHNGDRKLSDPLGATRMGLIYVNPEGPNGDPDPLKAAKDIRETFARMAMDDEETVALIAGGHTFGKAHGASTARHLGPNPESSPLEAQGFGWDNSYKNGKGNATITSGLEGSWTVSPAQWTHNYFQNLFKFKWVKSKSPAGATQWIPEGNNASKLTPDAHDPKKRHAPIMFTTDLALKEDPAYGQISKKFLDDPKAFELTFSKAWFKLTHRDMGPRSRYLGKLVPKEVLTWQDPIPPANFTLVNDADISRLKSQINSAGLTPAERIKTAWAAASSYRGTDKRGGVNGARIRLMPQNQWAVNNPQELKKVLEQYNAIQKQFNGAQSSNKRISIADLIVLGGATGIEEAARAGGFNVTVPFTPGRTDASQQQTDVASFELLKPTADGFRNYCQHDVVESPEQALVNKAELLELSIPEMTALVGGLRVLNTNYDKSDLGVLTQKPGALSNDFFVNLLDMSTKWKKSSKGQHQYEGYDRQSNKLKWNASSVDLVFGSNSELRAVAEVYASNDSKEKFIQDFVKAWVKVMRLDRFDLASRQV